MRKKLKIFIPVFIVLLIGFMAYKIYAKINQKQKIAQQIKTIPEFYFYRLDIVKTHSPVPNAFGSRASQHADNIFKNTDLEQNKATLIIYFHPDCEHCQNEAKIISDRIDEFKEYQLVFISYANTKEINTYANKHKLNNLPNITFLEDKDMVFDDVFGKSGIPASFIYNKQGKLTKQFKGEVKVGALLNYLEE